MGGHYRDSMSIAPCPDCEPRNGWLGPASFGCGLIAMAIAVGESVAPSITAVLPAPILIAVGFAFAAIAMREVLSRARHAQRNSCFAAAHRDLQEKVRWLEITEAHANVGHWRLDLATNDVFWSNTTFAIHGLAPGEPPSLNDALNFYHEDDREIVTGCIERARQTGDFEPFKARIIDANGELRHVESGACVECDAAGAPVALFGVFKDRTHEEDLQRELREASEEAHALARAKGMFLARMSHEIRTPMNGLLGFAELLSESELDEEQQWQANLIVQSGHALQSLLKDILDFTKIEAGKVELNSQQTDLRPLIEDVVHNAIPMAQSKRLRLHHEIDKAVPTSATFDAMRVKQILGNLLSNAVRFTDHGMVSVSVRRSGDQLVFAVSDTGIGIAPRMLEQIFEPFTQETSAHSGERGGTGLGLAISRQLAQLLGGTLTVSSTINEGSTFVLQIPLDMASAQHAESAPQEPGTGYALTPALDAPVLSQEALPKVHGAETKTTPPAGPPAGPSAEARQNAKATHSARPRVLLAEDHDINRELVLQMTARLPIELDCAEDGVEAVAMVHQARVMGNNYALVLMDLQMPRLDGIDATLRLRQAGISSDELPIVAVTANAFPDDIDNCLAAGMQAHLAKPMSSEALSKTIETWIKRGARNERASAA